MAETLQQINVALPAHLVEFIRRQAARQDHTVSGAIRHILAEAARREPPPEGAPVFPDALAPPVPAVKPDAQSIIEAKERLASLKAEREEILRRKRLWQTTVNEDTRVDRIVAEVEVLGKRIAAAEKMLPRNGGRHG